MAREMTVGDRTFDTRILYVGMVLMGIVFVSTPVLPVSAGVGRTLSTLAFGLMSGLWLAHLFYEAITGTPDVRKMSRRRLVRTYVLIAGVSSVSLLVFGAQFAGERLAVAVIAVGTVAMVSVILGALVAGVQYIGEETPAEDPDRTVG